MAATISPSLLEEGAAAAVAGAGAATVAGRGTLGAGCAGVGVRGGGGGGAAAAAGRAFAGAAAGGAETAFSTTPQCTQNFAPGWFSFPQAMHFIDSSSLVDRVSVQMRAVLQEVWVQAAGGPASANRSCLQGGGYYRPIVARLSLR
jgi:hypothetical protein